MPDADEHEETPAPASDQPSRRTARRDGPVRRLRRYAYRRWPSLLRDPDQQERLAFWWAKDGAENEKTAPPGDEYVDLHCVWAVELYTPAHIESLLNGFSRLGWDKVDDGLPDRNPVLWVRQLRETSQGGGWLNLHLILRPGDKRFLGPHRTAPLPPHIDHAVGEIFGLTSSLTCVVIGFVLDDEASHRFDAALRQQHKTYAKPSGRGYMICRPRHQKEAAIQAIRAELRATAGNWFRENLPGLFATGILGGDYPTSEFVTFRRGHPFPKHEEGAGKPEEYLHILSMAHDSDAWEWDECAGFRFAWPLFPVREGKFHCVLAVNENDLDAETLRSYGGPQRSAYVSYIDSDIKGLLSRWALLALLSAFERHLNSVRDSATFQPPHKQSPLRLLGALGNLVSKGADIAAVSSELSRFANQKSSFLHEVEAFKPARPECFREKDATLGEVLRKHIGERAALLEKTDRSVRDLLTQYGAVLGAQENIRLQRTIGHLTWFLVFLTVAILILTAVLTYDSQS